MSSERSEEVHKKHALELANVGVAASAGADHAAARDAWQDALAYAEEYVPDDTITCWIRSGLGAALFEVGDYHGAVEMAGSALEWCASQRAPLASLTMAKSLLRLGDVARAWDYVQQACSLRGDGVLKAFSAADRDALGRIAGSKAAP